MKKIISLVFTVFTVAIIFAAARPSLDGRAVVCEEGELPKGLFAKTIGYLPGDSVTVSNPANNTTVDVLILGSIDSSEGVAIMLSAEAAEKLDIKKDSNVQVKITRRTGNIDESVSGTAVLAEDSGTDTAENLEPMDSEGAAEPESEVDITSSEGEVIPESEGEVIQETEEENAPQEEENASLESELLENLESDFVEGEENLLEPEENPETLTEDLSESVETDSFEEPSESEEISETALVEPETLENTVEGLEEEPFAEEYSFEEKEPLEAAPVDADLFDSEEQEPQEVFDSEVLNEPQTSEEEPFEAEILTEFKEPEKSLAVEGEAEPEESLAVETEAEPEESEYAPIILSPAQPNPPEEQAALPEENPATELQEPEETQPLAREPELEMTSEPEQETVSEPEVPAVAVWEKLLTSEAELKKGAYYLQIATLSSEENLSNLVERYGTKYPLSIIRLETKKAWRILVGPLTVDEFGMIKERFESYGFKDAFLRKIK